MASTTEPRMKRRRREQYWIIPLFFLFSSSHPFLGCLCSGQGAENCVLTLFSSLSLFLSPLSRTVIAKVGFNFSTFFSFDLASLAACEKLSRIVNTHGERGEGKKKLGNRLPTPFLFPASIPSIVLRGSSVSSSFHFLYCVVVLSILYVKAGGRMKKSFPFFVWKEPNQHQSF